MMKKITFLLLAFLGISLYSYGQVSLCADAVSVTLPYTHTDDTANYADTNYEGSPGATGCGTTSAYLGGNNVVYAYTATSDTSLKINLTSTATWKGMFVYTDCANIGSACAAGASTTGAGPLNIDPLTVVSGQTYYIVLGTWPAPQTMAYTLTILENTCTNPTASYSIVSNCDIAPEFFVDVDITDLGTASSLTISDDQSSASQSVSSTGVVQFGPYPNGTSVVFTTNNDQDSNCFITSAAQTQAVCPPSNDLCANAIDLGLETSPLSASTVGATNNNTPTCGFGDASPDVYYSVLVPNGSTLTIQQTTNDYDSVVSMFYGDCSTQTAITCYDDPDDTTTVWANTTGADETVYFVVDGYGSAGQSGTFTLEWSVVACSNATATYTVVSNCDVAEEFFVDIDVTDLGTATSLSVSDDQGSAPVVVTTTGVVQFGPYANATPVIFTLANEQDSSCTITSSTLTQAVCPPDCDNATVISACDEVTTADFMAGSGAWTFASSFPGPGTGCNYATPGIEYVYSFTPTIDGVYSLEVVTASGGYVDYLYKEASGSCDTTGWTCIDDISAPTTASIGTLTAGVEYLFLLDSEGTTARTQTFRITCPPTCTDATVAYSIVSNCDVAEEFFVDVDITDLGTATSITVSDDQGSATQNVTTTGVIQFGPYPNATPVVFTVANDQDATCVLTSSAQTQAVCPPDCSTATVLECDTEVVADFIAGPGAWNVNTCGFSTPGVENMYSFTAPADGSYSLEVTAATGGYVDYYYKEASGSCDNTGWTCIDDIFSASTATIGTLTAGTEYLILLDSEGTTARNQTFKVVCPVLATDTFDNANFTYRPNPVVDVLNLQYNKAITSVAVYNIVGQQVITKTVNANMSQVDMSALPSGTYMVKVTSNNEVKTIKVVKE